MSTNLHLWGLGESKRLLVIALPLWDPQWRRSFLCRSELRIKFLVSFACLILFGNPRACLCPSLYLLCSNSYLWLQEVLSIYTHLLIQVESLE
jgi:hypothetical protein